MGMYTELLLKCCIKEQIPSEVIHILNYMFKDTSTIQIEELTLPNHAFFRCSAWNFIGSSSSFYHIPCSSNYFDKGYLFSRSDLKNYGNEIGLFLDWIDEYVDEPTGKCIGWTWHEEYNEPTLVYKR